MFEQLFKFQFKETNIPYTFEFFMKERVPHFCNSGEI